LYGANYTFDWFSPKDTELVITFNKFIMLEQTGLYFRSP
jgi:hypothetical protein